MVNTNERVREEAPCWCGGNVGYRAGAVVCLDSVYHDPRAAGGTPLERVRKLYLAGPMSGIQECNYPAFARNARFLREAGYEVVNPADSQLHAAHYVDFLREDLRNMLDCEGVAVLPEWEFSAGARNEVMVAGLLRMPVQTVGHWLAMQPPLPPRTQEELPLSR